MDIVAIEQYLHENIPLAEAMAVSVVHVKQDGVILSAPLSPNINHRSTVFGGSISAVAILAAWTYVHSQLQHCSLPCRIVIQSNSVEYLRPIEADFQARCLPPSPPLWNRFIKTLSRRGKGRILLNVEIYSGSLLAGRLQGQYVALRLKD